MAAARKTTTPKADEAAATLAEMEAEADRQAKAAAPVEEPAPKAPAAKAKAATAVPAPRRTLSQGDHGPKVDEVQRALTAKGFDVGPVNGRYGITVAKAVRKFQSAHGLHVTGDVNPATWEALVK